MNLVRRVEIEGPLKAPQPGRESDYPFLELGERVEAWREVTVRSACSRCGGLGNLLGARLPDGGICYRCMGDRYDPQEEYFRVYTVTSGPLPGEVDMDQFLENLFATVGQPMEPPAYREVRVRV